MGNRGARQVWAAVAAATACLLVGVAAALAGTGTLKPKECVGDDDSNVAGCGTTAAGMLGPQSVVLSPDGAYAYVGSFSDHAIVSFDVDPATGALTPLGCIADDDHVDADACPATAAGLAQARSLVIANDGKSLYAASPLDNAIAMFQRDPATGALTPLGCIGARGNNLGGCDQRAKGIDEVLSLALSHDGTSLYAASSNETALTHFDRDTGTGLLTPHGCLADPINNPQDCGKTAEGLAGASAVAVSGDDSSVYVTGANDDALVRFRRAPNGALKYRGCVRDDDAGTVCADANPGLDFPRAVVISHDGTSVYTGSVNSDGIARFERDLGNGALQPKGCIGDEPANVDGCAKTGEGLGGIVALAVSADGLSLYATSVNDHAVAQLNRNPGSGALTPKGCVEAAGSAAACDRSTTALFIPTALALSPDDLRLYSAATDGVTRFERTP